MAKQLNLLFIFTDQQRYDTLACYGNHLVQAPNLNRLAGESIVFDRAYVTQPLCTPARSSIMTGLYPHATGCTTNNVPLRADTQTIAEMVAAGSEGGEDYARAYIGKWHLGDEVIAQHGFETWISIMDRYRQHYTRPEYRATMSDYYHYLVARGYAPDKDHHGARVFSRRTVAGLPEVDTKARFVGREAAHFLREVGDRPFIAYANFFEPHPPFSSPFDELYRPEDVPVGPAFRERLSKSAPLSNREQAEVYLKASSLHDIDLTTKAGWRLVRARYLGLVTLVDRAVGDILRALDDTGLWDNTIIVFTSDHGDLMGDHGLFQKGPLYDGSTRVPLLMRLPEAGGVSRRIAAPVSQIDLVPTLLDLLGLPIPGGLHGRSLVASLQDGNSQGYRDVVVESQVGAERKVSSWLRFERDLPDVDWRRAKGPWRSIISPDRFKLNLHPTDQCELFDLENDPDEMLNLYEQPEYKPRIRDMADRLHSWQLRTGDAAELPAI